MGEKCSHCNWNLIIKIGKRSNTARPPGPDY